MADIAFSSVEKIVKIGLKIKEAADTVRRNEEECQEIQKVVVRVSAILSQLQQTKMMKGPAVDGALIGLEETLDRALKLVVECQEGHIVGRFFTAGGMSKELRRVQDDISQKMMLALFAINVQATIILTNIQSDGAHRLPSQQQFHVYHNLNFAVCVIFTIGLRKFTMSELKAATHYFSAENVIGKGGFSNVYKGVLNEELVVAIKKFIIEDDLGSMDFICYNWQKLQHKNIVKFLGYGVQERVKWRLFKKKSYEERLPILVEEYVPNGTLEDVVHGMCLH
nr:unnamed protein product [Digitaria exilis]